MAKIQSFPKSRLRNGEILDATTAVVEKMNVIDGVISPVQSFYDVLKSNVDDMAYSIVKRSKNEYTEELNRAKNENYKNRSAIFKVMDGYKNSRIENKRQAAVVLIAASSGYRKFRGLSVEDLIQDTISFAALLESDLYKEKITVLGLTDQVTSLKEINNECKEIIDKKIQIKSNRQRPRKTENVRIDLCKSYDNLVEELNSYTRRNGNDKFFELFIWWNAMIDDYRDKISSRYGAKKGGKQDVGKNNIPFPGGGEDDRPVIE